MQPHCLCENKKEVGLEEKKEVGEKDLLCCVGGYLPPREDQGHLG